MNSFSFLKNWITPWKGGVYENFHWYLLQRTNQQWMDGELVMDPEFWEKQKERGKVYKFIAETLNTRTDCFDFKYSPREDDVLRIQLERGEELEFVYGDGSWYLNNLVDPLESWDLWLLNKGIVKNN
ncbi:MAG: hypothetical protein RIF39_04235 [Cyclobacteriaceae bacterium]